MKKLFFILLCLQFSIIYSQGTLVKGKKLLTGTWNGNTINYYEQLLSFYLVHPVALDTAENYLVKKFNATIIQYDSFDGSVLLEYPKGTDILFILTELEKDSTLKGASPLIYVQHFVPKASIPDSVLKKIRPIPKQNKQTTKVKTKPKFSPKKKD